jgi:hypothetical protein
MATSQDTQQQLDQFNTELDRINQKIIDSGTLLKDNLSDGFAKAVVAARKLSDPLKDAESISKKLNALVDENEAAMVRRKVAEENYAKAVAKTAQKENQKNKNAEAAAKLKFDQVRAEMQISQSLEDQYRKLLEIAEAEDRITKEKAEQEKIDKMLGSRLKKMGSLYKDLLGPISILFTYILNAGKKTDTAITNMGKSMGISRDAAAEMYKSFDDYSKASKDGYANALRLSKAQGELTEQLGFQAQFSEEQLETYSKLTEIVGLSADEASKLNVLSAATGKSTRAYVSDLRSAAFYAQQTNRINISDKELLSSISKLSAGILVKFQGNPKAIAAAVVEAKKLGANLETVNKIGDSLLEFESSIENELEAELITGRKINLEKAREAALTGDQLDLTREISDQVGSLAEYQEMNVIAQTSLAKAFGLSRDEMSEMLMQQAAINEYGNEAAKLNKTQLEDLEKSGLTLDQYLEKQKEQQSIQEKFNNVMMELEATVGRMAEGSFGKLASTMAKILNSATGLAAIMAVYIARQTFSLSLTLLDFQAKRRAAKMNAADAAIEMAKSAAKAPVIGAILAGGVALAAFAGFAALLSKGDDVISPGYGKRMLLDKGSITAFNDNDTIVAGTNLGGGRRSGGDNSALVAAIDSLHSTMKTKSNDIYMDSQKVGTQVGRQVSTGTQQSMNSYRLA